MNKDLKKRKTLPSGKEKCSQTVNLPRQYACICALNSLFSVRKIHFLCQKCECDDACYFFFFLGVKKQLLPFFLSLINISMGYKNVTSSPFPRGSTTTAAEGNHVLTLCKQPSIRIMRNE